MDTGIIANVAPERRLDSDDAEWHVGDALRDGDDTKGLEDLFENPGEIWGGEE